MTQKGGVKETKNNSFEECRAINLGDWSIKRREITKSIQFSLTLGQTQPMRVIKVEKTVDYQPVSCTFHDHLEHFATKREQVTVTFEDRGESRTIEGVRIMDIIGGREGEYVQFINRGSEMLIRLDSIIAVNDKVLAHF